VASNSPQDTPAATSPVPVTSKSGASDLVVEVSKSTSPANAHDDYIAWNQPGAAVDAVFEDHGIPTIVDDDLLDLIGSGVGKFAKESRRES